MKLKNLFFGAVVALAAFACVKPEEIPAGIEVDTPKIEAGVDGTQIEVKVTSSEAWQALIPSAAQDWLHIVPAQGQKGVTSVKVSVDALGSGKGRSSRINFMAGLFTASIAVSQEGTVANGDGKTPQTAFSASEAYAWVMEHITTDNAPSDEPFYVKGFIHKIGTYKEVEQYFTGNSYGNATFYMSDAKEYDPNNEKDFEAYQVNYLGNRKFVQGQDTDIKIGDEVIIFGHLTKYKETAETMQQNTGKGAYIYSLNGVVEETEPQQEITSSTVADFIQKAEPNTYYRLTGKVSSFKTGTNNSGRNYMQFNITDDSGTILVYGFKSGQYEEWAQKLEDGGTVVLNGTYEYYADKQQHEVVNATIESFEAGQGQTEITDITVAEFIQKADPSTYYKLTGKVTGFYTGESNGRKYMGFNLSDATGTVVVYGFKDGQYDQWADKLKDYGTVVLTGTYEYYASNQQHEVMNTTIISFEEGEAPTEFEDVTIAEFLQKADAANAYRLSGIVTDFNIDDAEKKYMKITMKDDTGEILVYSFKEGEFDKWSGQITLGGAIVVVGTYKIYQGTPEVVEATIESFQANPDYKYCSVDGPTEIRVGATVREAEIRIKANSNWVIVAPSSVTGSNPSEGDGDAVVKLFVIVDNYSTEQEASYVFTLKCEAANVEQKITLIQSKAVPAGGAEVEFDIKAIAEANSWVNGTKYTSIEKDGVTLSITKGGGNTGKYYTSGNEWRFYQTESPELTISVADNLSFVSAKLTYTATNTGVLVGQDGAEIPSGGESTGTVYTVGNNGGATNGQVRFTNIVVTVAPKE